MWILVKANSPKDVGLHEERRILLGNGDQAERSVLPFLFATAGALEVNPVLGGVSSAELLRKAVG